MQLSPDGSQQGWKSKVAQTPFVLAAGGTATVSSQAGCTSCTWRRARHTALLHLKPEPKAICHTRSPRRTVFSLSMFDSTYLQHDTEHYPSAHGVPHTACCLLHMLHLAHQMDAEDTLPQRNSASFDGCTFAGVRDSCSSMAAMTPAPPVL